MTDPDLVSSIEVRFPGAIVALDASVDGPSLTLSPARLIPVCESLRDEPETRYDLLVALLGLSDYVRYQLVSTSRRHRLQLCLPLSAKQSPVDSLAFVWPAANWAEREAHDLWGITFKEHPGLQPLLVRSPADAFVLAAPSRDALLIGGTRYPTSVEGLFIHLELDGPRVVEARPTLGFRHSALEKQLERWPYERGTLLAARMDGFSAMQCDLAYALAIEKLLQIEPPPRAQHLRVIGAELQRIASHLFWLARCVQDLPSTVLAALAYAWEGRTMILDLFQELGGNPITPDIVAIGGLRDDAPTTFADHLRTLLDELQTLLDHLQQLLPQDLAFPSRLDGVGVIDPGTALGLGMTGPCLRASGIAYDVRSAFPYSGYESLDLHVPVERGCDASARYRVRAAEMRASLDLVHQAMRRLPEGPVNAIERGDKLPPLPQGMAYASVEGARGELGVYVVSDGSEHLQRAYVRGPSFANLSALPFMVRGNPVDQVATVLNSLDISLGEAER